MKLQTCELFDLTHTASAPMLNKCRYPYEALCMIGDFIRQYSATIDSSFDEIADGVYAARDAKVWSGATIMGPTIIGHNTEVRPGAFIRGNVIIGNDAVIGNSTEIKNSIVFDNAQLPHYNYVGDSIIGYKAHMGAGAIASNLRLDKKEIVIYGDREAIPSRLRKVGVFLGDYAEVGCGCVICPGSTIGRGAMIHPLVSVRGYIPEGSIYNGSELKEIH